jgi:flagellar hook assembly protein FlgD
VRAWDVLNNYSETQTYFRTVANDNDLVLDSPLAYPNPASQTATLTFTHNQTQPIDVEFSIFAADGRLVRRMTANVTSLHTGAVTWDCRNDDGDMVAQGAYTFSAVVTNFKGITKQISGMLQIAR